MNTTAANKVIRSFCCEVRHERDGWNTLQGSREAAAHEVMELATGYDTAEERRFTRLAEGLSIEDCRVFADFDSALRLRMAILGALISAGRGQPILAIDVNHAYAVYDPLTGRLPVHDWPVSVLPEADHCVFLTADGSDGFALDPGDRKYYAIGSHARLTLERLCGDE